MAEEAKLHIRAEIIERLRKERNDSREISLILGKENAILKAVEVVESALIDELEQQINNMKRLVNNCPKNCAAALIDELKDRIDRLERLIANCPANCEEV